MKQEWRYKLGLELIALLITAVIAAAVLVPVYTRGIPFPFYGANVFFIFVFFTFARYLLFLKYSWLSDLLYVKIAWIGLSLLLVVSLLNYLFVFLRYLDEEGVQEITYHLQFRDQMWILNYIKTEVLIFGVGSVIAAIGLPIRLSVSVWRQVNDR